MTVVPDSELRDGQDLGLSAQLLRALGIAAGPGRIARREADDTSRNSRDCRTFQGSGRARRFGQRPDFSACSGDISGRGRRCAPMVRIPFGPGQSSTGTTRNRTSRAVFADHRRFRKSCSGNRLHLVGARGFEPVTSCTPSKRANPSCATPRSLARITRTRRCRLSLARLIDCRIQQRSVNPTPRGETTRAFRGPAVHGDSPRRESGGRGDRPQARGIAGGLPGAVSGESRRGLGGLLASAAR